MFKTILNMFDCVLKLCKEITTTLYVQMHCLSTSLTSRSACGKVKTILSNICCAAHTFCHRKNLCSLQLLRTLIIC